MLDASIRVDGQVVGVLCLEQTGATRAWRSDEIAFAGELAIRSPRSSTTATAAPPQRPAPVPAGGRANANAFLLVNCDGVVEYVNPSFTAITQSPPRKSTAGGCRSCPALENLGELLFDAPSALNDLRLLSSGPQAGLGELRLPPRQAGSSLMPGKVNPVIPEVVEQDLVWVVGSDVTITMAAEAGQLQLNAFEPIMCHSLLQNMDWMTRSFDVLDQLCVRDIEVNETHLAQMSAGSVGVATALIPHLGYAVASAIAKAALAGEGDVRSLVLGAGLLDRGLLDQLLDPERLAGVSVVGDDDPPRAS